MPRPKKVEPPVGWPLLCGLALCTAKCPKPEWSEARKCWSGLAARSPMATHWIYKINQHERMYEVLGIQLVSVWSMCISTLVSSVIVSHFLDTSMIVQVESIRHLSYCLQAESCKWQVQPSPLLLGRESRIISAWVQNRHWGWDDIGRAEVVPPFLFFSFFSPGHLRTTSTWTWTHRISDHKKMWAKPDDSRLAVAGRDMLTGISTGLVCIEFIWIYFTMNMNIYFWEPG